MKNYLIALVITAAMTASASTVQQMHRHTPRTTITDDGQPIDKIAEITGMPLNTVKSHLSRGKEKLATYLKNNGYDR